jgi:hypothetical protein
MWNQYFSALSENDRANDAKVELALTSIFDSTKQIYDYDCMSGLSVESRLPSILQPWNSDKGSESNLEAFRKALSSFKSSEDFLKRLHETSSNIETSSTQIHITSQKSKELDLPEGIDIDPILLQHILLKRQEWDVQIEQLEEEVKVYQLRDGNAEADSRLKQMEAKQAQFIEALGNKLRTPVDEARDELEEYERAWLARMIQYFQSTKNATKAGDIYKALQSIKSDYKLAVDKLKTASLDICSTSMNLWDYELIVDNMWIEIGPRFFVNTATKKQCVKLMKEILECRNNLFHPKVSRHKQVIYARKVMALLDDVRDLLLNNVGPDQGPDNNDEK